MMTPDHFEAWHAVQVNHNRKNLTRFRRTALYGEHGRIAPGFYYNCGYYGSVREDRMSWEKNTYFMLIRSETLLRVIAPDPITIFLVHKPWALKISGTIQAYDVRVSSSGMLWYTSLTLAHVLIYEQQCSPREWQLGYWRKWLLQQIGGEGAYTFVPNQLPPDKKATIPEEGYKMFAPVKRGLY